jgi:hypothetical protein
LAQLRAPGPEVVPIASAAPGLDGYGLRPPQRQQFLDFVDQWATLSTLQDFGIDGSRSDTLGHAFRIMLNVFVERQGQFTLQPAGMRLARQNTDAAGIRLAPKTAPMARPEKLDVIDATGEAMSMCRDNACPSSAFCEDTLAGPVCTCPAEGKDSLTCTKALSGNVEGHRPMLLTDTEALSHALRHAAQGNSVTVVTVSSGFTDFFLNLAKSMERVGVNNLFIIAEDFPCYQYLATKFPGRVALPSLRMMMSGMAGAAQQAGVDSTGFSYASRQYNELVGRRPRYLLAILRLGFDVLYTDTDTVWLENPYNFFDLDSDLQIASDKEGNHPGCAVARIEGPRTVQAWAHPFRLPFPAALRDEQMRHLASGICSARASCTSAIAR